MQLLHNINHIKLKVSGFKRIISFLGLAFGLFVFSFGVSSLLGFPSKQQPDHLINKDTTTLASQSKCKNKTIPSIIFNVDSLKETESRTWFAESEYSDNLVSPSETQLPKSYCKTFTVPSIINATKNCNQVFKMKDFVFGMATTPKRLERVLPAVSHWLAPRTNESPNNSATLLVLHNILLAENGDEAKSEARIRNTSTQKRMNISFQYTNINRYEQRVVFLIQSLWKLSLPAKWYIIQDDDTFWITRDSILDLVASYSEDPMARNIFIGANTESRAQKSHFGNIAYGGGGIVLSHKLVELLNQDGVLENCFEKFKTRFGGDDIITQCIKLAANLNVMYDNRLHQCDFHNTRESIEFFQSGAPISTLHHWNGGGPAERGFTLFPESQGLPFHANPLESILLLGEAAAAIGHQNFARRLVLEGGKVVVSLGYSVVVYEAGFVELSGFERVFNKVVYYLYRVECSEGGTVSMLYRNGDREVVVVGWVYNATEFC
ncbi:hypothetical protein BDR26DRAFT_928818 [Obelidium mucronatum]|nr:hypothetical protein BDR26DRAFT_928818 [Obelidium mucronatum]